METKKDMNKSYYSQLNWKEVVPGFFSYFTIWTLIMFFLYLYHPHPSLVGITKTMTLQSSLGGLYFTYVYPKKIYVHYCKFVMEGTTMKILDILSHQLPSWWMFYNTPFLPEKTSLVQKYTWLSPLLFYSLVFSVYEKYQIRFKDHMILTLLFLCIPLIIL